MGLELGLDTTVNVDYSQYLIAVDDGLPTPSGSGETPNGLISVGPEGACVLTGQHMGDIGLRIEIHQSEPPLETGPWDEVVEASVTVPHKDLHIAELGDASRKDLPNLAAAGPGTYRLRVHATGRDTGREEDTILLEDGDDLVERHLIQVWIAPRASTVAHKTTDDVGADRRAQDHE